MPGLHVCRIEPQGTDDRGEWVSVANDGAAGAAALTGLEITDYTRTQQHVHIYAFPPATSGGNLLLEPRRTAFVFTGSGRNQRLENGDLLLFAGRHAPVWNNDGDVAYLREVATGQFVDSMTVGDPARHPNGH